MTVEERQQQMGGDSRGEMEAHAFDPFNVFGFFLTAGLVFRKKKLVSAFASLLHDPLILPALRTLLRSSSATLWLK